MILEKIGQYLTDLIPAGQAPNPVILIEETNFNKENDTDDLMVIGELASTPIGNPYKFDGENDLEDIQTMMQGSFVINFYGTNARSNAMYFFNASKSQLGYEKQRDANISIYHPSTATKLSNLEGNFFKERYEIEIIVKYTESIALTTLTIETAEISYLFNK